MSHIPLFLRKLVVKRAGNRCEYCRLSQKGQEATFHVDHIVPLASGGETKTENLALACVSCSLRKGAREFAINNVGEVVRFFHPRKDVWTDHFEWRQFVISGKTNVGKATVDALMFNRRLMLSIREEEFLLGRHPVK